MFLVGEKVVARGCFERLMPAQLGPRNCGQSSACSWTKGVAVRSSRLKVIKLAARISISKIVVVIHRLDRNAIADANVGGYLYGFNSKCGRSAVEKLLSFSEFYTCLSWALLTV